MITAEKQMEKIDMYSSTGQLVVSKRIDSTNGFINLSGLPAGLYIVSANTKVGIIKRKIIVK